MEDTYKRIRRKEIGENELDWFRSYFIDENRTDWLIDKRTAYEAYCEYVGPNVKPKSVHKFKVGLIRCAQFFNLIYNPTVAWSQKDGRISVKFSMPGEKLKTHELIYLQSTGAPLNEHLHPEYNVQILLKK